MEIIEKQINPSIADEASATAKKENSQPNPGLRALLSLRNCNITLEKEYVELIEIENNLDAMNKTGEMMIATHCNIEIQENWKVNVRNGDEAIAGLNKTLEESKAKIEKKEAIVVADLWKQLVSNVRMLRESTKKSVRLGFELLPETEHSNWEKDFVNIQQKLVDLVVSHVDSCRVLLQMMEKYTPEELNIISKIVVDKIPLDFTYNEAVVYEQDYFKALVDFKQEFKEEKNLWDKFLDILAGGTHQPPSERVMMERWIEGEKGDLT